MKAIALLLLACSAQAGVNITKVAAATTIGVNVLEYKDRYAKLKKVGGGIKKAVKGNSGKGTLVPAGKAN